MINLQCRNECVVVLAAGRGFRLGCGEPKVLIEIAGKTLLDRHRETFLHYGFSSQIWVLGYEAGMVEYALKESEGPFETVINEDYEESGSGYSLKLGLEKISGETCVLDADLLYDPRVFEGLKGPGSTILYSPRETLDNETMKVYGSASSLMALQKSSYPDATCLGEAVGLCYLDEEDARAVHKIAEGFLSQGGKNFEWESLLVKLTQSSVVKPVMTKYPWIEIDFPADIEAAECLAKEFAL